MALFASVCNPLCDAAVLHVAVSDGFVELLSYLPSRVHIDTDVTTNWNVKNTVFYVDRFSKFFHCQNPKQTLYVKLLQGVPPHPNCVATLPCEIRKLLKYRLNFYSYHQN